MEQLERHDALDDEGQLLGRGYSKDQILQFSLRDIDELYLMEHLIVSARDKKEREEEVKKKEQRDYGDPNEGGPRPPKADEYPDDEDEDKDDLLSEVSDPNEKD